MHASEGVLGSRRLLPRWQHFNGVEWDAVTCIAYRVPLWRALPLYVRTWAWMAHARGNTSYL